MFNIKYNEIDPFVTANANIIMRRIHGDSFDGDMTVVATVRALLFERTNADEEFDVRMRTVNAVNDYKVASMYLDQTFGSPLNNSFTVTNITNEAVFKKISDALSANALKTETKYRLTELTRVSDWLRNKEEVKLHTRIFINEETGSAYIMAQNLSVRFLHLISSLMPKYLPKFFKDKPLQPYERELLETLTQHRGSNFLAACTKVASHMDLREAFLRGMIGDFEKREMETMLNNATHRLNELQSEIESCMQRYSEAIRRHQDQMFRVEGIKLGLENNEGNSDLMDYLIANKNVDVIRVSGNRLDLEIRTFMDIFDIDMWKRYAANGTVYTPGGTVPAAFKELEDRKLLINALFEEEPVLRLKFCGYYYIDLNGNCGSDRRHTYKPACDDYLINPHLYFHACLGSNRAQITQQLTRGEIIGAIECAAASCKSVNMGEISQTIRPMIQQVLESNKKIIRNADGVDMTPVEALNWLKERAKK